MAASRDGAEVAMVGAVGDDALAEVALSGLREAGADTTRVRKVAAATGCASIWIDAAGRNRIVVALGANGHTRADQLTDADLARATSLLLQMEVDPAQTTALLHRARALQVRSILNLAPALPLDLGALRLAGLLVVNEDEAEATAARLGCTPEAASLRAALGIDVVRTLGEAGSEAATADGAWHVPARAVGPVDTTAAGDCFVGVLAASLDRGADLRAAMERASVAAALACGRRGSQASLPWRAETDRRLDA
ncbi:PfkB family carbohydrate kinase [Methylobacterium sp. 17Sr1-1]|uniref:PfkB family carbohydrate kinase n=1 Tax=Methylobacterium sp. 17Sr1-1 TaxID=2202826 RepID=UPI0019526942|nr:PfkB family carbohydrate kinase [Methylobacterium sp. 17Sr1-1]